MNLLKGLPLGFGEICVDVWDFRRGAPEHTFLLLLIIFHLLSYSTNFFYRAHDLCASIGKYLRARRVLSSGLIGRVFVPEMVRDLADFNAEHKSEELALFGQERWLEALKHFEETTEVEHERTSALLKLLAGTEGIDKIFQVGRCDCLVCSTTSSSFRRRCVGTRHSLCMQVLCEGNHMV
eukprot:COSAG05_NODE_387_length_10460_cov_18.410096_7_plen_180_part_00